MADRFRQIEAFLRVAEAKNFTRAGESIGLSQPALSLLINQFEQEIGLKLFDRTTRSVELTHAGREFLPDAERIFLDIENSTQRLKNVAAVQHGRLRITALPSLCATILPRSLQVYRTSFPGITVQIDEALAGPLVETVARGSCDFGIGVELDPRDGVRFEALFDDELILLCHSKSPYADNNSVPWRQLNGETIIAMGEATSVRRTIDYACAKSDVILSHSFEVDYMASVIGLVRFGLGISILPSTALTDLNLENIVMVRLVEPVAKREVGILSRSDRVLSPAASSFTRLLNADIISSSIKIP